MTNLIFTHDDCRYHGDKRPREAADDTPHRVATPTRNSRRGCGPCSMG